MESKGDVLITGASGFIGNFLVDEALLRGYNVYVSVRQSTNINRLKKKQVNIVEIDFTNITETNQKILSLPQFEYVIHNAGVTKSLNKKDFFEVNDGYTQRLIFALIQQRKVPKKFFYMSSLAAFGPGEMNSSIDLLSKPNPVTQYGKSKLAADRFITEKSGIPYIIFRPTAVYGPGDKDFFQTIKLIYKGADFQVGTKPQTLTFIYVKDLSRLVFDAVESSYSNKAYFVTDGNLYNSLDLGKCVSRRLNKKMLHIAVPIWLAKIIAATTEGFSKFTKKPSVLNREKISELSAKNWNCNIQPLVSDFNFKAEYDLEKGINETVDWYKKEGWLK
ncbi:MAG: NAD(P)-dependent oxidoreductase [Rikenellaceae bacterium]